MTDEERTFAFLRTNRRPPKPRARGVTEIRGPYYSVAGKRYLKDLFDLVGAYVDGLKFAGGSFTLLPRRTLREIIDLCHHHEVYVSTGGYVEYVLTQGTDVVNCYIDECRDLGFDMIEVSSGFITLPDEDVLRLIRRVVSAGLKAKAEVGIQFGAGGATAAAELEAEGIGDPARAIARARRCLEAGASMIMVESEGITESVRTWRTDMATRFAAEFGTERVMFEAADPAVFAWYIKQYGPDMNLFVDHSQIIQLECLRQGMWGTADLWGRVLTYGEGDA